MAGGDGEKPGCVKVMVGGSLSEAGILVKTQPKDSLDFDEESFSKEVEHYKIIGANNPFQFWMVKVTDEEKVIFSRLRLFKHLQEVMGKQEKVQRRQGKEKVPVHLEKYKLYLSFHQGQQKWHRVRLLRFDKMAKSLLVYYVDYPLLELARVPLEGLRELPDEFIGYPVVPVYKSYLYDVTPRLGGYKWGEDVVEWFRKVVKRGSIWLGMQMAWDSKWAGNGPDQMIDVGVVLFEDNDNLERNMSVNYRLVKLDHGRGIGIGATHFSNLYLTQTEEPLFSLEHIPPIPNTDWCSGKLPIFVGNRWPQVAIRRVYGPNCIYVTLMSKYKEYLAMYSKMVDIFEHGLPKVNRHLLDIGLGCLVGFKNARTVKTVIHRCVVVGVNGPKTVEVMLVDVGEIMTVPVSTLYALPKRVKRIPAFVHRVHLKNLAPAEDKRLNFLRWESEMEEKFNKFVEGIGFGGRSGPSWFAVRSDLPFLDDVINLREVHGELAFDKGDKQWIGMGRSAGNLDNYERQVMIKNHLHSFGVDLMVMRKRVVGGEMEEELDWGFERLTEIIVKDKRFKVEDVGVKMDKKGYYDGLLGRNEKK